MIGVVIENQQKPNFPFFFTLHLIQAKNQPYANKKLR